MDRISWDQYFMAQSQLLALRSTCKRLMVGATIVRDKRIIAGGYNGSVSGSVHCVDEGCYVIDGHCVRTVHAEANAILQCAKFGVATENAHIYVTHFPCLQCCKQIIQAGIKKVYYADDYRNHPYAIQLFEEANVEIKKVTLDYLTVDTNYREKEELVKTLLEHISDNKTDASLAEALKEKAAQIFEW
ncbi:ComE operon protein 2 [Virgibacillus soli]|uniref:ComE operon protein 2 n=1 Tax=Paracerasibacillus soli TaxID=480284 RepID=A0ABU5CQ68_9BACI|nr:ComE operon protein 2 [Virgibacillus soli]MDY0408499.1 ComE operon protein 2 [Virgibacillus soli]